MHVDAGIDLPELPVSDPPSVLQLTYQIATGNSAIGHNCTLCACQDGRGTCGGGCDHHIWPESTIATDCSTLIWNPIEHACYTQSRFAGCKRDVISTQSASINALDLNISH